MMNKQLFSSIIFGSFLFGFAGTSPGLAENFPNNTNTNNNQVNVAKDEVYVNMPSVYLRGCVNQAIGNFWDIGAKIPLEKALDLKTLVCDTFREISDLRGLEEFVNLTSVDFVETKITDISPLRNLTNLQHVGLSRSRVSNISSLSGLTKLESLNLAGTQVKDVSPLIGLENLTNLDMGENQIKDASFLLKLKKLTNLNLQNNQFEDTSSLREFTNLSSLNLYSNKIKDVSGLGELTNLTNLMLGLNQISDISPLKALAPNTNISASFQRVEMPTVNAGVSVKNIFRGINGNLLPVTTGDDGVTFLDNNLGWSFTNTGKHVLNWGEGTFSGSIIQYVE